MLYAGTEETGTTLNVVTGYVVITVCAGQLVTSGGQLVTVRVSVVYIVSPDGALADEVVADKFNADEAEVTEVGAEEVPSAVG